MLVKGVGNWSGGKESHLVGEGERLVEEGVVLHNQGRLDLSNHSSMVSETNVCVCVCVSVFQPLSLQSVLVYNYYGVGCQNFDGCSGLQPCENEGNCTVDLLNPRQFICTCPPGTTEVYVIIMKQARYRNNNY